MRYSPPLVHWSKRECVAERETDPEEGGVAPGASGLLGGEAPAAAAERAEKGPPPPPLLRDEAERTPSGTERTEVDLPGSVLRTVMMGPRSSPVGGGGAASAAAAAGLDAPGGLGGICISACISACSCTDAPGGLGGAGTSSVPGRRCLCASARGGNNVLFPIFLVLVRPFMVHQFTTLTLTLLVLLT